MHPAHAVKSAASTFKHLILCISKGSLVSPAVPEQDLVLPVLGRERLTGAPGSRGVLLPCGATWRTMGPL